MWYSFDLQKVHDALMVSGVLIIKIKTFKLRRKIISQGEVFTYVLDIIRAAGIKGDETRLTSLLSSLHFQVWKALSTQI